MVQKKNRTNHAISTALSRHFRDILQTLHVEEDNRLQSIDNCCSCTPSWIEPYRFHGLLSVRQRGEHDAVHLVGQRTVSTSRSVTAER